MKILAIDPGYERLGVAVIEIGVSRAQSAKKAHTETLLFSDCITTSKKLPHEERLKIVGESVRALVETWQPEELAIEELFFNENRKTALLVAQAFGVILYEAARAGIPAFLYTPPQIKIAVTGHGHSNKNQVTEMVQRLINMPADDQKKKILDDEYDAIAIGLTHTASRKSRKILDSRT